MSNGAKTGMSHLTEPASEADARLDTHWPRVAVYGAGAVGCYFGAKLAEAGAPVTLIGRPAHVEVIRHDGLLFESGGARRHIPVAADSEPDAVRKADIVLFCVKTRDTDAGAQVLASRLRPGAVVLSLQNGVDNVARMREAGVDPLGAVVYVAASMPAPGHLLHAGRGDLVVGEYGAEGSEAEGSGADGSGRIAGRALAQTVLGTPRASARSQALAAVFERAGVPCRIEADVRGELWTKLVMNCAFNAISALGRSIYGRMLADADIRSLMRGVIAECVAVAHADGVRIASVDEQYEAAMRLGAAMAQATSSMAQDLARGRLTEIDSLNGYVARRGAKIGVATPLNAALAALVRLLERTVITYQMRNTVYTA